MSSRTVFIKCLKDNSWPRPMLLRLWWHWSSQNRGLIERTPTKVFVSSKTHLFLIRNKKRSWILAPPLSKQTNIYIDTQFLFIESLFLSCFSFRAQFACSPLGVVLLLFRYRMWQRESHSAELLYFVDITKHIVETLFYSSYYV